MEQSEMTESAVERYATIGQDVWVMSLTDGALAARLDRIRKNVRSFTPRERAIFLAEAAMRLDKQNF